MSLAAGTACLRRGRRGRLGVIIYLACQCACRASGRVRRIRVPGPSGGVGGRGGQEGYGEGRREGGPLHLPHQRHIPAAAAAAPIAPRRRGCVSITIPIASLSGSDRNVQITSRTRKKNPIIAEATLPSSSGSSFLFSEYFLRHRLARQMLSHRGIAG